MAGRKSNERIRKRAYNSSLRGRYTSLRNRARLKRLPLKITISHFAALLSQPCFYCRGPLSPTGSGLDRKDSSQGYTLPNVVPCCNLCNRIKSDLLSFSEMVQLSPHISSIISQRSK